MKKRTIAMLMAVVMLFGATIGGTIAWLTASTSTVTNTFVKGDIIIELDETKVVNGEPTSSRTPSGNAYDITPGTTYLKDPKVTVKANSEECWLFVKFEETTDAKTYYDYTSMLTDANGWAPLEGVDNVFYRKETVKPAAVDQSWYLLEGNTTYPNGVITVKDSVGKTEMAAASNVTLKWTAYAVQSANLATAKAAWDAAF